LARTVVPDMVSLGFSFNGFAGVGAGTGFKANWLTRGDYASLWPTITMTQSIGAGYQVGLTGDIEFGRYSGGVNQLSPKLFETMSPNGDIPTIFGSGELGVGMTGNYTPIRNTGYHIRSFEFNIGPGFGGAGGLSNSKIIWRR
jgi:hypothetical protein